MTRYLRVGILSLCVILPLAAQASDMDRVVRALEADLGVRHTHIPMLGMAMFMGKVATGFRMPGVKLATFSDEKLGESSPQQIEHALLSALGPKWSPIVKSTSNYGDDQNWIYLGGDNKKLEMFIVSVERNELSLVEVKMSESQMRRWINDTDDMVKHHRSDNDR